jgi:hypothetical protein
MPGAMAANTIGKVSVMRKTFDQQGAFEAMRAAEKWCDENGISYGRSQADAPTGLLRGNFDISKWRNMSKAEIAALDGTMTGNLRDGPVIIQIKD